MLKIGLLVTVSKKFGVSNAKTTSLGTKIRGPVAPAHGIKTQARTWASAAGFKDRGPRKSESSSSRVPQKAKALSSDSATKAPKALYYFWIVRAVLPSRTRQGIRAGIRLFTHLD
jgi:hypothetical protein